MERIPRIIANFPNSMDSRIVRLPTLGCSFLATATPDGTPSTLMECSSATVAWIPTCKRSSDRSDDGRDVYPTPLERATAVLFCVKSDPVWGDSEQGYSYRTLRSFLRIAAI